MVLAEYQTRAPTLSANPEITGGTTVAMPGVQLHQPPCPLYLVREDTDTGRNSRCLCCTLYHASQGAWPVAYGPAQSSASHQLSRCRCAQDPQHGLQNGPGAVRLSCAVRCPKQGAHSVIRAVHFGLNWLTMRLSS